MAEPFFAFISHFVEDDDKVTLGFMIADQALDKGSDSIVFLVGSGVLCVVKGTGNEISIGKPFPSLDTLISGFLKKGGKLLVSSDCLQLRGYQSHQLLEGVTVTDTKDMFDFVLESKCLFL